ncbi:MAG: hypothetical protein HQM16_01445 [Deltaproteobacteria bacterium]|nr:hypothetical protein [Deltaproteobacteria bacterium]
MASTAEDIGDQPIVSADQNENVYDILPAVTTHMAVYASGTLSRLFVMGGFVNDLGNTVLNRVLVLDFDGVSFSEPDFSPIEITDGADATDETDNSFADLLVDQQTGVLYITDATAGMLYAFSAVDGTTVTGPLTVAGEPQGMSLDNGRLYICNTSSVDAEQLINVVNVSDDTTTGIDIGAPCQTIAVQSNNTGAVLLVKPSNDQKILIHTVNTTTYAASAAIAAASTTYAAGELTSGAGITSSISDIVISVDSAGLIYAYLSELDGNIQMVSVPADLSAYLVQTLSTSIPNLTKGAVLEFADGSASQAFIVGETGALVTTDIGAATVQIHN